MKFQNAHVFVVDIDSYPIHRDRLFCGIKNPPKLNKKGRYNTSYFGLYADILNLRIGDIIFFYQMRKEEEKLNRGFRGIFKVINEPFFDDTDIDGVDSSLGVEGSCNKKVLGKCPHCNTSLSDQTKTIEKEIILKNGKTRKKKIRIYVCRKCKKEITNHILPIRILIEPIKYFEPPIDDNTAYIDRKFIKEKGMLWTMLFRKTYGAGRERSITHILPEEKEKLEYMFDKLLKPTGLVTSKEYPKSSSMKSLTFDLITENGELAVEGMLEAWLMENIGKEDIKGFDEILGNKEQIEYFGNGVLYGIGGEKVDILIIHNNGKERIKATVIELKKGSITSKDIKQIKDYTKWMSQLVFGDDSNLSKLKIQPVLIGLKADEKRITEAKNLITDTQKPILMEYEVKDDKIKFNRIL